MMAFAIQPKGDIVRQYTKETWRASSPASLFRRRAPDGYRSNTARTLGSHRGFKRDPIPYRASEAARPLSRSTLHSS